jgi:hypothetical protein
MDDNFSNITKRGVDQNKTVAEAIGDITNVGEEKYAMADSRKVVKTAAGHETISFTDTDQKIVTGTTEVDTSGGYLDVKAGGTSSRVLVDNVRGQFLSPDTSNTLGIDNDGGYCGNDVSGYDAASGHYLINKEIFIEKTDLFRGQKRDIVKGWDDPYTAVYTFTDSTRTLTATHPSGTCSFYSGGTEYDIPNGDPLLSVVIPDLSQWNYAYHDTDGQLKSATSVPLTSIRETNLGPIILFLKGGTPSTGTSLAGILRSEAKQANEVENEASYETKSIIASVSVEFDSTILGNVVGHTGGVYYSSRDKRFEFGAVVGASKTWVKYYQDGIDDAGCNWVKASVSSDGIPYITDVDLGIGATGRLLYNNWNPALNGGNGAFEVLTGATNDYVSVHYIVGDGLTRNVLCTIGQATYNSLADARAGLSAEREGLVFETTVFRDVGIVASCIFKTDGQLQYYDTDTLELFDYPAGGVTAISGIGSATTLQTTYNNSVQPQITIDGTRGSFQLKDGIGGGAAIFEVLNSSDAAVLSVSDTGIDAGGKDIVEADQISTNSYGPPLNTSVLESLNIGMSTQFSGQIGTNASYILSNTYFDGGFKFKDVGFAHKVLTSPDAGVPSFQIERSTASGASGGAVSWDTYLTLDQNGTLTLPQANNTNIDLAGAKAVPTVEYCDSNYVIVNGAQATNDWGTNYSSVNIGGNSTIAYDLETTQYGNMWQGVNFYLGNDGIPRYKNNGTAIIHRSRNDNSTSFREYTISFHANGTAGDPVGTSKIFTFDGFDGTLSIGAGVSDINQGDHVTTKAFCDSTYSKYFVENAGVNLDTYLTIGITDVNNATGTLPTATDDGSVQNIVIGSTVRQEWRAKLENPIWVRHWNGSTWTAWVSI